MHYGQYGFVFMKKRKIIYYDYCYQFLGVKNYQVKIESCLILFFNESRAASPQDRSYRRKEKDS